MYDPQIDPPQATTKPPREFMFPSVRPYLLIFGDPHSSLREELSRAFERWPGPAHKARRQRLCADAVAIMDDWTGSRPSDAREGLLGARTTVAWLAWFDAWGAEASAKAGQPVFANVGQVQEERPQGHRPRVHVAPPTSKTANAHPAATSERPPQLGFWWR